MEPTGSVAEAGMNDFGVSELGESRASYKWVTGLGTDYFYASRSGWLMRDGLLQGVERIKQTDDKENWHTHTLFLSVPFPSADARTSLHTISITPVLVKSWEMLTGTPSTLERACRGAVRERVQENETAVGTGRTNEPVSVAVLIDVVARYQALFAAGVVVGGKSWLAASLLAGGDRITQHEAFLGAEWMPHQSDQLVLERSGRGWVGFREQDESTWSTWPRNQMQRDADGSCMFQHGAHNESVPHAQRCHLPRPRSVLPMSPDCGPG